MKALLISVLLLLLLSLIGWIGFSDLGSKAVISIDKQEIKEDTQEAAGELSEVGKRAAEATREAAVDAERELDELDEETSPPQAAP